MANDVSVEISFYGLCLFVLDAKAEKARVLLLNSSQTTWQDPLLVQQLEGPTYHHPLLQVDQNAFVRSDLPRIPNIAGVSHEDNLPKLKDHIGWYIAGLDTTLGTGKVKFDSSLPIEKHPKDYQTGDWSSMGWVPSFNDINPGCTLDPDCDDLTKGKTSAIVNLAGGDLVGNLPSGDDVGAFVWSFSPAWQQAITDTVVFRTTLPGGLITLTDIDNQPYEIELKSPDGKPVQMWLSHEAGPRERKLETTAMKKFYDEYYPGQPKELVHFSAFYPAFKDGTYPYGKATQLKPARLVWPFVAGTQFQDTPVCISGRYME